MAKIEAKSEAIKFKTNKGSFILVEVDRAGVVFQEGFGYLMYNKPDYDNWVSDEILSNPVKLDKWLAKNEGKSDWKKSYVKLPEGNWKFIAVLKSGLLDRHEASQNVTETTAAQIVDDNGAGCYDNYLLKKDEKYTCKTAMDSFACLMRLLLPDINPDTNYAILQANNTP